MIRRYSSSSNKHIPYNAFLNSRRRYPSTQSRRSYAPTPFSSLNPSTPSPQPDRSTLLNFPAVAVCVLVLCPLTGIPIACLLPLYVPISRNLVIFPLSSLRRSFSIFMLVSSAVMSSTVCELRELRRAVEWMCRRASRCRATWGPMP